MAVNHYSAGEPIKKKASFVAHEEYICFDATGCQP